MMSDRDTRDDDADSPPAPASDGGAGKREQPFGLPLASPIDELLGELATTHTPADVARVLLGSGLRSTGARGGALALSVDTGAALEVLAVGGDVPATLGLVPGRRSPAVGQLAAAQDALEARWCDGVTCLAQGHRADRSDCQADHVVAELPLALGAQPLGRLTLCFARPGPRPGDERAQVQSLARLASLALSRVQLSLEAEGARRLRDEFLSTLSHELRTPLNAVLGWARLLRMHQLDATRQDRALEAIERNARAQAQLIDDLLDVSSIISGRMQLRIGVVPLGAVVSEAVEALRPAAEARRIELHLLLDSSVGSVAGDADRLKQVAWNLVSNAIKFTPPDGRVTVRLTTAGEHLLRITVSDSGIGIDPAFAMQLFERFHQADTSMTRRHGGLGLGLALVRHIVELHGGSVRAESEGENRGATFVVELPARGPRSV